MTGDNKSDINVMISDDHRTECTNIRTCTRNDDEITSNNVNDLALIPITSGCNTGSNKNSISSSRSSSNKSSRSSSSSSLSSTSRGCSTSSSNTIPMSSISYNKTKRSMNESPLKRS